jgi:ABC-type uncharacterized transport system fused permease/ATPase subunit
MVDEYTEGKTASIKTQPQLEAESEGLIRLHDAVFTWGSANGKATPGFRLTIPEVTFEKGKINLITGPTGSGKSSLLKVSSLDPVGAVLMWYLGARRRIAFLAEERLLLPPPTRGWRVVRRAGELVHVREHQGKHPFR